MRRYQLLFGYNKFPNAAWKDRKNSFDTLKLAEIYIKLHKRGDWTWIIDSKTGELVSQT
jgi:hypothetical protein